MKHIAVIQVITTLELGGAQKVGLSLFKKFSEKPGFKSYLITGGEGPLRSQIPLSDDIIILPTLKWQISMRTLSFDIQTFRHLTRIFRDIKKDHTTVIIHTHTAKAGILGRWAAWWAGIPTRVHTIHGHSFLQRTSRIGRFVTFCSEWITSLITTHFVCVSQKDHYIGTRYFPFFSRKASLIRAAIDETLFNPAHVCTMQSPQDAFIIGTIGCFKPVKNTRDLLKAFALIKQTIPHARLEIIGDGELRPTIEAWIKDNNFTDCIVLHGWQHTVIPLMQQWHIFSLTSFHEGLPCALVEAHALGLPAFCYDVGGISEVINTQSESKLFEVGDWEGLAKSIIRFWQHPPTFPRTGILLPEFTTYTMIAAHEALYTKQKTTHTNE